MSFRDFLYLANNYRTILRNLAGRKLYDSLSKTWSTGEWLPVFDNQGMCVDILPIWED